MLVELKYVNFLNMYRLGETVYQRLADLLFFLGLRLDGMWNKLLKFHKPSSKEGFFRKYTKHLTL